MIEHAALTMRTHASLTIPKEDTSTAEAAAKDFLAPFKQIVEGSFSLRETEEEIKGLVTSVMAKIEKLSDLKQENMALEREVLLLIKAQL